WGTFHPLYLFAHRRSPPTNQAIALRLLKFVLKRTRARDSRNGVAVIDHRTSRQRRGRSVVERTAAALAAHADGRGEAFQHWHRLIEAEASVGDALAECERFARGGVLTPGLDEALDHDTDQAAVAFFDLH